MTIDWLIEADPAISWQVSRDLLDAPESVWRETRARVATEGWGAELLGHQNPDGQWAGGAFFPAAFTGADLAAEGQPWTATSWALGQLREFGIDPELMRDRIALIGENSRWDHDGQPYWDGEVEECINGRTVADGAYFGVDVSTLVERLLTEQLDDGGWNCERVNGSVRSSFDTTVNVLEGLREFERVTGGTPASTAARLAGEEYLLCRSLFRRLATGEPADSRFLTLSYPPRWKYDVLRGLEHFRAVDRADPRLGEAIEVVRSRQLPDGRWDTDGTPRGRTWLTFDERPGQPSRWVTLKARRVLRWWDSRPA